MARSYIARVTREKIDREGVTTSGKAINNTTIQIHYLHFLQYFCCDGMIGMELVVATGPKPYSGR